MSTVNQLLTMQRYHPIIRLAKNKKIRFQSDSQKIVGMPINTEEKKLKKNPTELFGKTQSDVSIGKVHFLPLYILLNLLSTIIIFRPFSLVSPRAFASLWEKLRSLDDW